MSRFPMKPVLGVVPRAGFALGFLALLVYDPVLRAQVSTADIVGTVTDSSDAVMAGVRITATNLATGLPYISTTNASGDFAIPLLPAGHYRIQAEMPGFRTWSISDVELTTGARLRADAKLAVGDVEQTLEVSAQAGLLQTDSATVSTTVSGTQVENLPVNGRNFVMLALTVPGASSYTGGSFSTGNSLDDRRRSSAVSVNGRFGAENNFTIDGLDDNEKFIGSVMVKPSMEGLAEMNVVTSTFSAELSRTAGAAIVMITKGGTNEFHGSAFEFMENRILNARPPNLQAAFPKPQFQQNNFGGSIGGPVKKNNTFFFFDWETYRQNAGQVLLGTVPLLPMRTGNFSGYHIFDVNSTVANSSASSGYTRTEYLGDQMPASSINQISQRILNLYPLPTNSGLVNNFQRNDTRRQNDNTMDMRYDHRFSDKDNFFIRYSYDRIGTALPTLFPQTSDGFWLAGGGHADQSVHGLAFNNTYTVSPRMVILARAGFARYVLFAVQQGYGDNSATKLGLLNQNIDLNTTGFPDISITNFTGTGAGGYQPDVNYQNTFSGGGALQYIRGSHNIKVGADVVRRQVAMYQSQTSRPAFAFTTAFTADPNALSSTGNAVASFLQGYPQTTTRLLYLIHPGYRYVEDGAYIQDDWRATRKLTVNIGMRWDYYSPLSEAFNRINNWDETSLKLIYPGQNGIGNTNGVAKDWKDFSPRLGFAYELGQKTVIRGGIAMTYDPTLMGTPGAFRNPPFNSNLSIAPNNYIPANKISDPIPYPSPSDPINIVGPVYAVQRGYKTPYAEQFNMTIQRDLPWGFNISSSYVGSLGKRQSGSNASVDLNGAPIGSAPVNSRRFLAAIYPNMTNVFMVMNYYTSSYNALQNTISLRNRHSMTFSINHTWSHTIDDSELRYTGVGQRLLLKATSPSDARHRVNITWNWALPYGKDSKNFIAPFIRNWRLNAVGAFQTGLPFSINQTANQTNSATDGGFGAPNANSNYPNVVSQTSVPSNPAINQWFNPAAFAAQPNLTWGNGGRDQMVAPGFWNFDLGIAREFKLKEKYTLQFRGEAFDFTNTETPNAPVSSLGSPGFGFITTYSGSRIIQVALKILF